MNDRQPARRTLRDRVVVAAFAAAALLASSPSASAQREPVRLTLEGGTGWINTGGPIHAEDLKGKIVVLDFWTYCCINCHHVLPDLAFLEEKYKNELVVIGIHTPKFTAEQDTDNLRKKVAEYRIKHPVINDARQAIWTHYGIESWPTIAVFNAKGHAIYYRGGEGQREILDRVIGEAIVEAKANKELNSQPFVAKPEAEKPHDAALKYPGKVVADGAGKRLFISDTGNNRVVVVDFKGEHIATIGSGREGKADGEFASASFNRPQGMCLLGETLYVADTENHSIRAIDLKTKKVATVAGTGAQATTRAKSGPAKTTALSSPWDVVPINGGKTLAIAMAGTHQIWKLDLDEKLVSVLAGSGLENITDGTSAAAAFAQPSGLATDGDTLFVADSETSSLRTVGLKGVNKGHVGRIVGQGLFDYADVDGRGPDVRLQHDLGVAYGDGKLYVADTYNNKVKVCDPATKTVKTLAGTRESGNLDEPAQFDEPGGVSLNGNTLYVADTNNHAIRAIDVKTGKTRTVKLTGVAAPAEEKSPPKFPRATRINVGPIKVAPGSEIPIEVTLKIPDGYKLNPDSPIVYLVEAPGPSTGLLSPDVSLTGEKIDPPTETFTIKVPLSKPRAEGEELAVTVSMSVFVCKKGSTGFCTVQNYVWDIGVNFAEGGQAVKLTNAPVK
jgi:DNA-binding beta-propeller fold protein YncE